MYSNCTVFKIKYFHRQIYYVHSLTKNNFGWVKIVYPYLYDFGGKKCVHFSTDFIKYPWNAILICSTTGWITELELNC